MQRSTFSHATPGFIADWPSVRRNTGRNVDWANVPASYIDADTGKKKIRAGTPMAEIDATGLMVPRGVGVAVAGRTTIGLIVSDAHEPGSGPTTQVEGYNGFGVFTGAVVFEQLLPQLPDGGSVLDATVRTELANLPGGGIAFEQYSDNRAS